MGDLVFTTVLMEIKNAFKDTVADPDLIELLYDAIALPLGLENNTGSAIAVTKGTASKIMNREKGGNPLRIIRKYSTDKRVTATIVDYFRNSIIPRFLDGMDDEVALHSRSIINADMQISNNKNLNYWKLAIKVHFLNYRQAYLLIRLPVTMS